MTPAQPVEAASSYPVTFDVDYPERQSRWKALFRIVLVIPALLFSVLMLYAALFSLFPMWIAILIRGRIPRWLFDFQVGVNRFNARVQAYFSLLTDVYPAFDGDYPARYEVEYPARISRRRLLVWKLITSLPHWVVVWVLQYAAFAVVAIGWLSILFTGQFPRGLHSFVVGVSRWRERVYAYTLSLRDEFPPFSLSADAPAARGAPLVASAALGAAAFACLVALLVVFSITSPFGGEKHVIDVSYQRLLAGQIVPGETRLRMGEMTIELLSATDPETDLGTFVSASPGHRLVLFTYQLSNDDLSEQVVFIGGGDFKLADDEDGSKEPILVALGRRAPPVLLDPGATVTARVVFEVPEGRNPTEVWFETAGGGLFSSSSGLHYRLR